MVTQHWETNTKIPVLKWLQDRGYKTKIEVKVNGKFADVAGLKKGELLVVECKESECALENVLDQCMRYTKGAHRVYIAFDEETLKKFYKLYNTEALPIGIFKVLNGRARLIKKPANLRPSKKVLKESIRYFHKAMEQDKIGISYELSDSLWIKRLKRGITTENVWFYILLALQRHGKVHAYRLRKLISKEFGFKPGIITVYRAAYSLENGGLINSNREGVRKYYIIGPKGTLCLMEAKKILRDLSSK